MVVITPHGSARGAPKLGARSTTANVEIGVGYKHTSKFAVPSAGNHTFSIRRREKGYVIDRIVLKIDNAAPTGNGPAESPRGNQQKLQPRCHPLHLVG